MTETPVYLPRLNANDESVKVTRWVAQPGDLVKAGAPIAELETSKAALDLDSPCDGYIELKVPAGEEFAVGALVAVIRDVRPASVAPLLSAGENRGGAKVSRKAEKLAAEHGIDASTLKNTGIVTESDVLAAIAGSKKEAPEPPVAQSGQRRKLNASELGMKATVMRSWRESAPAFMTRDLPAEALFSRLQDMAAAHKKTISPIDVIICVVYRLLAEKEFQLFNSYLDGDDLVERAERSVGVTIEVGGKLVIGRIAGEDCAAPERVTLRRFDIAMRFARRALQPSDIDAASFSVSAIDSGALQAHYPIIPPSQSGILGITGIRFAPVIDMVDAKPVVAARRVIGCCLSYDHRYVTGMHASRFLDRLAAELGLLVIS